MRIWGANHMGELPEAWANEYRERTGDSNHDSDLIFSAPNSESPGLKSM